MFVTLDVRAFFIVSRSTKTTINHRLLTLYKFPGFGQKTTPYHREFDGSRQTPVDRSDEDINYTYPDRVQLVPNIPVSPQSPKYSLVPIRRPTTTLPYSTAVNHGADNFQSSIPPDIAAEIEKIRVPHFGRLSDFNSGPQPYDEEDEEDEGDEDEELNEHDNNHDWFSNGFVQQPQYKNVVRAIPSPRFPVSNEIPASGLKIMVKHRPEHTNPLAVTHYPSYDTNEGIGYENSQTPEEYRQLHSTIKHNHDFSAGHSPFCNEKVALRHYGPPQPVPSFRQFNHAPYVIHPRPPMPRTKRPRTYIRYPRNYRTYYHHPAAHNRVKVMTQSFVYHPTEYYRDLRNPVMMPSTPQLRNAKSPTSKRKKKRKKSKSKGIKGECKPKKIIKEIHFHHYDPQLSAQLAPLEGINLKDGEDYENDIKVITKETEVEDDDKKKPNDYDEQYNQEVQKELHEQSRGRDQRLTQPDYYGDAYNNQYSETGSVEYIDYNVQTDSSSSSLMGNNPQPAVDFTENERSFRIHVTPAPLRAPSNSTGPARSQTKVPSDRNPETLKYHNTTPDKQPRQ